MNNEIISRLPSYIYSGDSFEAMTYRPRNEALTKKYINPNYKNRQAFLMFDIDSEVGGAAWYDAGLPQPTWTAINGKNGHAHSVYMLETPVSTSEVYMGAVDYAMTESLGADRGYVGLITKNPFSEYWHMSERGAVSGDSVRCYSLGELSRHLDLIRPHARIVENAIGRHLQLFDTLRTWAYKAVREFWNGSESAWFNAVEAEAVKANIFLEQLKPREVYSIARSVARHVWRNFTPQRLKALVERTHAPELQRARRAKLTEKQNAVKGEGLKMLSEGASIKDVTASLKVSRATVYNWTH